MNKFNLHLFVNLSFFFYAYCTTYGLCQKIDLICPNLEHIDVVQFR